MEVEAKPLEPTAPLVLTMIRFEKGSRGTNALLVANDTHLCHTIERPWLNNQRRISCVPVGVYLLTIRHSKKFGKHLLLNGVQGRDLILIHPANDAMRDLNGCIGPVTTLAGIGRGSESRAACKIVYDLVFGAIEKEGRDVYIEIIENYA